MRAAAPRMRRSCKINVRAGNTSTCHTSPHLLAPKEEQVSSRSHPTRWACAAEAWGIFITIWVVWVLRVEQGKSKEDLYHHHLYRPSRGRRSCLRTCVFIKRHPESSTPRYTARNTAATQLTWPPSKPNGKVSAPINQRAPEGQPGQNGKLLENTAE